MAHLLAVGVAVLAATSACGPSRVEGDLSALLSRPVALAGRHLTRLNVDRVSGCFAVEVRLVDADPQSQFRVAALVFGRVTADGARVSDIGFASGYQSLEQRYPVSERGVLASCLSSATWAIAWYEPEAVDWRIVRSTRPADMAARASDAGEQALALLGPMAWHPEEGRFAYYDCGVLRIGDLEARGGDAVVDGLWPDFPVLWPVANRLFFGRLVAPPKRHRGFGGRPPELSLFGDIYCTDPTTRSIARLTDTGLVMGYSCDATGDRLILAEYTRNDGPIQVSVLDVATRAHRKLFTVVCTDANRAPGLARDDVLVTLQGGGGPVLGLGNVRTRSLDVLRDAQGAEIAGHSPRFIADGRAIFVAQEVSVPDQPAETSRPASHEYLALYEFGTRTVTRIPLPDIDTSPE